MPDARSALKEAIFGPLHLWYVVALIMAVCMIVVILRIAGQGQAGRRALFWLGLLALLTGMLEMIPVIGPGAAVVIAGVIAIGHAEGPGAIIAYAIYATALRLSIDQLVGPLVLGHAARLHPTLVIFCFLSGGLLLGIAGLILAVPIALAIKVTLAILYEELSTAATSRSTESLQRMS